MKWEVVVLEKTEILRIKTFECATQDEAIELTKSEDWQQWQIEGEPYYDSQITEINEVDETT